MAVKSSGLHNLILSVIAVVIAALVVGATYVTAFNNLGLAFNTTDVTGGTNHLVGSGAIALAGLIGITVVIVLILSFLKLAGKGSGGRAE